MPIFEYLCHDCSHRFETFLQGSDQPVCPDCRGRNLQKQLSVFAVSAKAPVRSQTAGPCGACGDPRGPGACSLS